MMGNLFKLILFLFLLQGINAALTNMEPKNWDDVIFDSQYGDDYCFSYVRPLLNQLKRVKKQIDAHDEMKENYSKLEKELEGTKIKLEEQETKLKYKEDLLNGKDEQIKYLKDAINGKDEKVIEQNEKYEQIGELLKTKNDLLNGKNEQIRDLKDLLNLKVEKIIKQLNLQIKKTTGNSQDLKDFINSKAEQISEQLKEQNAVTAKNSNQFQDLKDLINLKVKEFGEQLKTKNESESKGLQINELKNSINEKNERIGELKAQISENSKILEEKNPQLMKYNQQEENIPNFLYDGIHRIKIADQPAFEVSYVSPLSEWIVIQRRMDGSVNFDRDWEDYKKGFGDIQGEFFLGLEKLHLMTQSKPHELYIQMRDVNGTTKYAHYDNFNVGSEEENFKLISLGKYSGTAGDALEYNVGCSFSTKDRDNDDYPGNCGEIMGGWWSTPSCGFSYLNGKYHKDGITKDYGVVWFNSESWKFEVSLTFVQMLIRPTLKLN